MIVKPYYEVICKKMGISLILDVKVCDAKANRHVSDEL